MFGRKGLQQGNGSAPVGVPEESNQLAAKIKAEAADCHPLVLAAKMTGFLSPPPEPGAPEHITVADIDHPTICDARDGEGLSFSFFGQRGEEGIVYLYSEFAAIWPKTEARPRPRIPAELLRKYVPQYTQSVAAVIQKIRPPVDPVEQQQSARLREQLKQFLG